MGYAPGATVRLKGQPDQIGQVVGAAKKLARMGLVA